MVSTVAGFVETRFRGEKKSAEVEIQPNKPTTISWSSMSVAAVVAGWLVADTAASSARGCSVSVLLFSLVSFSFPRTAQMGGSCFNILSETAAAAVV